jgi:hypothetical protein
VPRTHREHALGAERADHRARRFTCSSRHAVKGPTGHPLMLARRGVDSPRPPARGGGVVPGRQGSAGQCRWKRPARGRQHRRARQAASVCDVGVLLLAVGVGHPEHRSDDRPAKAILDHDRSDGSTSLGRPCGPSPPAAPSSRGHVRAAFDMVHAARCQQRLQPTAFVFEVTPNTCRICQDLRAPPQITADAYARLQGGCSANWATPALPSP